MCVCVWGGGDGAERTDVNFIDRFGYFKCTVTCAVHHNYDYKTSFPYVGIEIP